MDQFWYKIIEESWSKKRLCDYLLVLQKEDCSSSEQYILSFFEKLFALLVTSYMSQDLERGDNYLQRAANGLSNETLWKTATKISMNVPGVLFPSIWPWSLSPIMSVGVITVLRIKRFFLYPHYFLSLSGVL